MSSRPTVVSVRDPHLKRGFWRSLEDFAFSSRTDHAAHIITGQYVRLVDEWVTKIGLPSEDYGTRSLRRTKASIVYKATGNLRAVQILLGHKKIESTVRYLEVDVEDALTASVVTTQRMQSPLAVSASMSLCAPLLSIRRSAANWRGENGYEPWGSRVPR